MRATNQLKRIMHEQCNQHTTHKANQQPRTKTKQESKNHSEARVQQLEWNETTSDRESDPKASWPLLTFALEV